MTKKDNPNVEVKPIDESLIGADESSLLELSANVGTVRGLKSRHIQLIALGGAIGTGLFVGSGAALSTCGPAGLLTGYSIVAIVVWLIMSQLSEMVTLVPLPGEGTTYAMAYRYTSRSFAFTTGWNIYFAQAMIGPTEITACAFVIEYWTDTSPAIYISIFLVFTVLINFLPVKFFGESEFYVCSIKILCITGLIIMGVVMFFGGAPKQHGVLGFKYWNEPGAFVEHLVPGDTGKFLSCWTAVIKAGFAFILAPELVTATTSEAEYPRRNIPIVARRFVWRLIFFYVVGALVIGVIVASNDDRLMGAILDGLSSAAASPFVVAMKNFGIPVLPHIVNACILTSAYSCGSGLIYGASRALFTMALKGDAPKIFARTNKGGVPYMAVGVTSLFLFLAYLNMSSSASTVFSWLSNIATIGGFTSWLFVCVTYIRYRKAITAQGLDDRVPYRAKAQYVGAYAAGIFLFIVTITNGYAVFINGAWSTSDFFSAYITIIIDAVLYVGALIWTKEYKQPFIKPEDVDVTHAINMADAEQLEHKAVWDEEWAPRTHWGWKIHNAIF